MSVTHHDRRLEIVQILVLLRSGPFNANNKTASGGHEILFRHPNDPSRASSADLHRCPSRAARSISRSAPTKRSSEMELTKENNRIISSTWISNKCNALTGNNSPHIYDGVMKEARPQLHCKAFIFIDHTKIRGYGLYENTNRKVALKLLPVKGLENMPHCSFLKK